ncbi:MAG TPA: hypothetical protein VFE98_05215 [Candidatus Bathyarchaeia archaeon]|nr:hypothetical protein [Candidatus Bathyarchaeia archaeon]
MQAQTEKMQEELLGEYHGKVVTTTIKEISPSGVRLEINEQGHLKGKRYDVNHMETASIQIKPDGTSQWETKGIDTTKDGDAVVSLGGGTGRSAGPNVVAWEGQITYMTQSPRLSWLNNATVRVEGTSNTVNGEIQGKFYLKK